MEHRDIHIVIDVSSQTLYLHADSRLLKQYPVSTGLAGVGQQINSNQTPLGKHIIRAKIGEGCPVNTVFVGRRPTGEIYNADLAKAFPDRDWILTRILWLGGLEPGLNRFGSVDTFSRYIYIHATPDENPLSVPLSHGCIRMHSFDMMDLFDSVDVGTPVHIIDGP